MLRQFLEIAAHLFVVYFDVAALLILVLVYKSWRAACGPFYSLKTWLLMKRTLWESGPVRRTMWLHTLVDDWFTGWFFFFFFWWLIWCEMPTVWGGRGLGLCVCVCVWSISSVSMTKEALLKSKTWNWEWMTHVWWCSHLILVKGVLSRTWELSINVHLLL